MATSAPTYDLVVIGGGTAGLVSAFGAAAVGARVAIVERDRLGGDCLNVGCVPSKTLLRSARAVREVRAAAGVGVRAGEAVADFPAIMARVRERRALLAPNDSSERLTAAGIEVIAGEAAFASRDEVVVREGAVDGGTPQPQAPRRLRFRRAIIATGSRPAVPAVAGLASVRYHTNETIFDVDAQPSRLFVIGAGAIGCELAQAFALFGTDVTVADVVDRPLSREDPDASTIVRRALEADGVRFVLGAPVDVAALTRRATDAERGAGSLGTGDLLLVAAGRTANVDALNLDAAGVRAAKEGVVVNDRLQTTNPRIFAAGDVASPYKFTHAADAAARIAVRNALFFGRGRAGGLVIPWCTYTMPEVSRVGDLAGDAITVPLGDVDRAVIDGETDGFVRVYHRGGRIVGCTIVAPHAGEMIGHVAHLMRAAGRAGALSQVSVPYPTYAEALRKVGDAWQRTRLTPGVKFLFRNYFRIFR